MPKGAHVAVATWLKVVRLMRLHQLTDGIKIPGLELINAQFRFKNYPYINWVSGSTTEAPITFNPLLFEARQVERQPLFDRSYCKYARK